jgi:hypothetical protein
MLRPPFACSKTLGRVALPVRPSCTKKLLKHLSGQLHRRSWRASCRLDNRCARTWSWLCRPHSLRARSCSWPRRAWPWKSRSAKSSCQQLPSHMLRNVRGCTVALACCRCGLPSKLAIRNIWSARGCSSCLRGYHSMAYSASHQTHITARPCGAVGLTSGAQAATGGGERRTREAGGRPGQSAG